MQSTIYTRGEPISSAFKSMNHRFKKETQMITNMLMGEYPSPLWKKEKNISVGEFLSCESAEIHYRIGCVLYEVYAQQNEIKLAMLPG